MRILVLYQTMDRSTEDEADTLTQVQEVSRCLKGKNHIISQAACATLKDIEASIAEHKPDVVVNLVESFGGADCFAYLAAGVMELLRVPYTGNSVYGLFSSGNKHRVRMLLKAANVAIPGRLETSMARYIVKSVTEHASFGIDSASVVSSATEARDLIAKKTIQHGGEWFAEEYIDGREINLSLLEVNGAMTMLPPAEILFNNYTADIPKIVDYNAKWNAESYSYHNTPQRFIPATDSLFSLAQNCWDALELRGYARIDLRLDKNNIAWVIDVNANPCLSSDAGFIAAAQELGMTQTDIVLQLIKTATYEN